MKCCRVIVLSSTEKNLIEKFYHQFDMTTNRLTAFDSWQTMTAAAAHGRSALD